MVPESGKMADGRKYANRRIIDFFDWEGDGVPDHVAIVEKCKDDIIYTVEGNTSTRVNGESVRGVWKHQYAIEERSVIGFGKIF